MSWQAWIGDGDPAQVDADRRFAELMSNNEDDLLKYVAKVNRVYQEKLKKPAPFMTFVFCGMQSAGKSTVMECFMTAVLNIVKEGTGTRCPLATTCIHDDLLEEPTCELWGEELAESGKDLTVDEVFKRVTKHNRNLVYRANNVQNMRFVDTPGIIANASTGKDNREDIKEILRSEMQKPNTKLCILLEPTEFAKNPFVDFCDKSLGGREEWIRSATFLMTKFDKQLQDSRTGSKANTFFEKFHENKCFPHLYITITVPKEDLLPQKLYEERQKLLTTADAYEKAPFRNWRDGHDIFCADPQSGGDELLDVEIQSRIGFASAKDVMREIMLVDTAKRIPEVLAALRAELDKCRKEHKTLQEKMKFTDPAELRTVVTDLVFHLQKRVLAYLDGDLESAREFPAMLQTLEDEIEEEEDSEWAEKDLNYHTEKEIQWRSRIANLDEYP